MPRLILIHGYVEDPSIFDALRPLLPSDTVLAISVEAEFDRWPPNAPVSGYALADALVRTYVITADDLVIGHSMGGWIAINIKAIAGARVVQLASFTDQRKVVSPVYQAGLLRFIGNTGLLQTRFSIDYVKRRYPFAESRTLNNMYLDRTRTLRPAYIGWQLAVLFAPVPPLTVSPDARIHAVADNIVRPPDAPYHAVPGDHYCLVFHPEAVFDAMRGLFPTTGRPTPAGVAQDRLM